jgi:hypothetical protein
VSPNFHVNSPATLDEFFGACALHPEGHDILRSVAAGADIAIAEENWKQFNSGTRSTLALYVDDRLLGVCFVEPRSPQVIALGFLASFEAPFVVDVVRFAMDGIFQATPATKFQMVAPAGDLRIEFGYALGAKLEGVFRSHEIRAGRSVDMVSLAIFREDFYTHHDPVN